MQKNKHWVERRQIHFAKNAMIKHVPGFFHKMFSYGDWNTIIIRITIIHNSKFHNTLLQSLTGVLKLSAVFAEEKKSLVYMCCSEGHFSWSSVELIIKEMHGRVHELIDAFLNNTKRRNCTIVKKKIFNEY